MQYELGYGKTSLKRERESKRKCILVKPSPSQVQDLHRELQDLGFKTYDKTEFKYRDVL